MIHPEGTDLALLPVAELRRIRSYVIVALEDLALLEDRIPEDERLVVGSQLLGAQGDLTNLIGDEEAA